MRFPPFQRETIDDLIRQNANQPIRLDDLLEVFQNLRL
jgi:hypothetical protein